MDKGENLLTLYFHKYKTHLLGVGEEDLTKILNLPMTDIKKHASKFTKLKTKRGKLTEEETLQLSVYEEYKDLKRYSLLTAVKKHTELNTYISKKIARLSYPHRNLKPLN